MTGTGLAVVGTGLLAGTEFTGTRFKGLDPVIVEVGTKPNCNPGCCGAG